MNRNFISLLSGAFFGVGLVLSNMTDPSKVKGFLDLFYEWDPTLIFVMIGAISVHSLSYILISKKHKPIFDSEFFLPSNNRLDRKLIIGSMLFGVGWAISGLCPGPVLASLFQFEVGTMTFFIMMLIGMKSSPMFEKVLA